MCRSKRILRRLRRAGGWDDFSGSHLVCIESSSALARELSDSPARRIADQLPTGGARSCDHESTASERLLYPAPILDGCLVVVGILLVATGQLDLVAVALRRLVRDQTEKMPDEVEARPPLVVGAHDVPGCVVGVGRLQHQVSGARVIVP